MKNKFVLSLVFAFLCSAAFAQSKMRRLPSIINHPSLNLFAPYISLDGDALLFISNNGEDGALTVYYTSREVDWSEPVEIPKTINTRLNFLRGYALSADGKKMYFTSAKSPVVGGYDIFESTLKGSTWTPPENLALPINTRANEGCPSFTPDGNTIYFMRCDQMDQQKASGCKIMMARRRPNGQWQEPEELPSSINSGNAQTPRIMADGETLIFSSDKIPGGRGGMDLYLSRFEHGRWTSPRALDFVNTERDDQYVSVAALGRYLLKEHVGARKNYELTEFLFPEDLRPKGMMKVEGKIAGVTTSPVPAYISIIILPSGKRIYNGRPMPDGSYFVYLQEGAQYEMSVDPEQSNITYYSKIFDLTSGRIPQKEKVNVILKQPEAGDEIPMDLVTFDSLSGSISRSSEAELKRLARLAKANTDMRFEIQVMLKGYVEDSVRSAPDLTELLVDSVSHQIEDIDSTGQLYLRDTVLIRTTYHNDRTQQQAEALIDYLVSQGAKRENFTIFRNAIPAPLPQERKLTIKAVVKN